MPIMHETTSAATRPATARPMTASIITAAAATAVAVITCESRVSTSSACQLQCSLKSLCDGGLIALPLGGDRPKAGGAPDALYQTEREDGRDQQPLEDARPAVRNDGEKLVESEKDQNSDRCPTATGSDTERGDDNDGRREQRVDDDQERRGSLPEKSSKSRDGAHDRIGASGPRAGLDSPGRYSFFTAQGGAAASGFDVWAGHVPRCLLAIYRPSRSEE